MVRSGHAYQSRFESFPVETDAHFYRVNRYVDRKCCEQIWPTAPSNGPTADCGSGNMERRIIESRSRWPISLPRKWLEYVHEPVSDAELAASRRSVILGTRHESTAWGETTARKLGLEATLRKPGRPKQGSPGHAPVSLRITGGMTRNRRCHFG